MNRLLKKALIAAAVMVAVAGAVWVGRQAHRKSVEHGLVAQAAQYIGQKDTTNAMLSLRQALTSNPNNSEATRLMADLLEASGSPAALDWRIRAFQLRTNDMAYRLAWAETALRLQDARSAAQALSSIDGSAQSSATFHKLTGALAWDRKDAVVAEREYQEALRLEPANQAVVLNLATIHLTSTNPAVADGARGTLENIPTNSPLRLTARRYLMADAVMHKSFDQALKYSQDVVNDPAVTYADKIQRLELLQKANAPGFDAWKSQLLDEARNSMEHAFLLGRWLVVAEGPTNALRWLQSLPEATQTNLPVPLVMADCQIALHDWKGLRALVDQRNWGGAEYYRLALLSLAARQLGENELAAAAWQESFSLAGQGLERLTKLIQITRLWAWKTEPTDVLREVVARFPREQWAVSELMAALYEDGNSGELEAVLVRVHSANPSDNRIKNNLAAISLLRDSNATAMETAHRLAKEAYDSAPVNPYYICTYAYSLLLQHKPEEAVKIIAQVKPEYLKNPSVAAYYGVVQALTGHTDTAREPLKLASGARLLPEEMQLVKSAAAKL